MELENLAKEIIEVSQGSLKNDAMILQLCNKLVDKCIELEEKIKSLDERVQRCEFHHPEEED